GENREGSWPEGPDLPDGYEELPHHVSFLWSAAFSGSDNASTTRSTGTDARRCAVSTSSAELLANRDRVASSPGTKVEPRNSIRCPSARSFRAAVASRTASARIWSPVAPGSYRSARYSNMGPSLGPR